jgi:hypothetical protein
MRLPIMHNGNYIVEFDQLTVHGREATGGYGFAFSMRGGRQACQSKMVILDISLSISLAHPVRPLVVSIPSSARVIQCHNFAHSEQVDFETVLSSEQVNALEEYRQDEDLKLSFGLRALVASGDEFLSSFDCTDITVPREQWLNALEKAGYRNTLLFEIPLPATRIDLKSMFSKAQEFIETGHFKDAVMQCRHIVEQVESIRGDKKSSGSANNMAHGAGRKDMNAIERLLSLREQLKNICQLGAHGTEAFTRSQAKAVLGMTMVLLAEPTVGFAAGQELVKEHD